MNEKANYHLVVLNISTLSVDEKEKYALFIPVRYRTSIEGEDPYGISFTKMIAVGVIFCDTPIGLVIGGYLGEMLGFVETYTIKIASPHNTLILADHMLQKYEEECLRAGAVIMIYNYRKTDPDASFIEKVQKKRKWSPPKPHVIRYFFDGPTFHPSWYERPPQLPPKYKLFPWKNLKQAEREQLQKNYREGHFSENVYPFQNEETIEFRNSLGLKYKGKIVGWSITHRVAPDTVKYTALYVQPEFQFRGYAIRLLVESTKLQQKCNIKWALFEIKLGEVDPSWFKFVLKRLAPYAFEIDTLYQTWKATSSETFKL
jgi:hypothetical protein